MEGNDDCLRRRFVLIILTVTILHFVACEPPPYDSMLSEANCPYCVLHNNNMAVHHRAKRATKGFKYMYITQCGIYNEKPGNESIEVAATLEASDVAHDKAARLTYLMLRFMPMKMFLRLAKGGRIGVFAADQVIGDFPEYAKTKNTEKCGSKCNGNCRSTCNSSGRKFDSLVGYSSERAVVREDNLLCSESDPYNGKLNVLMHEFAHNIHFYVLGVDYKRSVMLERSFNTRLTHWGQGYATQDMKEYFAEATTSYFRTSLLGVSLSANMNVCGDPKNETICPDEFNSRENLKAKDPLLFELVDDIYSGYRTFLEGRVGVCDW